jgi:hypothetical protein
MAAALRFAFVFDGRRCVKTCSPYSECPWPESYRQMPPTEPNGIISSVFSVFIDNRSNRQKLIDVLQRVLSKVEL